MRLEVRPETFAPLLETAAQSSGFAVMVLAAERARQASAPPAARGSEREAVVVVQHMPTESCLGAGLGVEGWADPAVPVEEASENGYPLWAGRR